jgi:uncharacterized LabA/DUF88 family protein
MLDGQVFKPRFAICIDGGFIQKVLYQRNKRPATAKDILAECERILAHEAVQDCDLLRIYYYDAPAAQGVLINPIDASQLDLQAGERTQAAMSLRAELASAPNVALRMGEVRIGGWQVRESTINNMTAKGPRELKANDLIPNLRQKGVDIRIGLDIARLSLNDTVRSLVVVTGDTDFVPAFKFARREGIKVYLDTLGRSVLPSLIEHSDLRLSDIFTPEDVKRERQRRQRARARERRQAPPANEV